MDEKLAKNVLNQMDLCTKMVMQQNDKMRTNSENQTE